MSLEDVDLVSMMLRICKFMVSLENVCCQMFYIVAFRIEVSRHDSCVAPLPWLILPVVICLSQRLSLASLSINYLHGDTPNGLKEQI